MRWAGTRLIRNWFAHHRTRGAAIPFEAPALRMARVCEDERDGMAAVLRDFANNGAAYIVPWTSLPLAVPMSDRDMAVHKAVSEAKACTPAAVRSVVSRLALSGVLGPEARTRESASVRNNQSGIADVELVLILHLLHSCGAQLTALMANPVRWRDAELKAAVAAAASAVGIRRQDIYHRVAEFARVLAPVGLVTTEHTIQSGWLRVLHDEIEAFGQGLPADAPATASDAAADLAAIVASARRTAQFSGIVLSMIDYAVLDIAGTIRRWSTELPVIRQAIDRLSLILDEWPCLMKSVNDAMRGPAGEVSGQLRTLRAVLPETPKIAPPAADDSKQSNASASPVLAARLSPLWSIVRASRSVTPALV